MKNKADMPSASTSLPDDLAALFASTAQATPADLARLEKAAADLNKDPAFVADVAKGLIVEDILRAMEAAKLNRNTLAAKIGKSRQYVGKILDEHRRANFTIDTLAELATALGVTLQVRMLSEKEQSTVGSQFTPRTKTAVIEDFHIPRHMRNHDWTPQCFQPTNVIDLNQHRYEPTRLSS